MQANEEFKRLFEQSGWTQAHAARQLELKGPSVSRYLSGKDRPSAQTLRLFRILLREQTTDAPAALNESPPKYQVEAQLAALPEAEREEVLQIFNVLVKQAVSRVSYGKHSKKGALKGRNAGGS